MATAAAGEKGGAVLSQVSALLVTAALNSGTSWGGRFGFGRRSPPARNTGYQSLRALDRSGTSPLPSPPTPQLRNGQLTMNNNIHNNDYNDYNEKKT